MIDKESIINTKCQDCPTVKLYMGFIAAARYKLQQQISDNINMISENQMRLAVDGPDAISPPEKDLLNRLATTSADYIQAMSDSLLLDEQEIVFDTQRCPGPERNRRFFGKLVCGLSYTTQSLMCPATLEARSNPKFIEIRQKAWDDHRRKTSTE